MLANRKKLASILLIFLMGLSFLAIFNVAKAAVIFSSGFESGSLGDFTGQYYDGVAPSVVSDVKHSGTYAGKFTVTANGGYADTYKTLASSYATVYDEFYVRFSALPASGKSLILGFVTNSGASNEPIAGIGLGYYNGVAHWKLSYEKAGVYTTIYSSSTPSINTWYKVGLAVNVSGTLGTVEVYINDVKDSGLSDTSHFDNNDLGNVNRLFYGIDRETESSYPVSVWIDDISVKENTGSTTVYYNLAISASGCGSTNPVVGSYQYASGSFINVTATPSSGWLFSYWLLNGTNVGTTNPYTLTMNANYNLTAIFSFENFNLFIGDDFSTEAGNWQVISGSYTIQNSQLKTTANSIIRSKDYYFGTNVVYAKAGIQTIEAGSNSWDVGRVVLRLSEDTSNNRREVYGLIHTYGQVELCVRNGADIHPYYVQSSLSPFDPHIIEISITGNVGRMSVDGVKYIESSDDWFSNLFDNKAQYIELYNSGNSVASFDYISVYVDYVGIIESSSSYHDYCIENEPFYWDNRVSNINVASGDNIGVWYTLPWSFPYYGTIHSRVYISSNGFLLFDPTPSTNDFSDTQSELRARWMIAPFWDDLRTDVSGGFVSTPGVYIDQFSDRVVINWEATRSGSSDDSIFFQTILYQSGNIRFSINTATNFNNFSPTIGISKGTIIDYIDITGDKSIIKTWMFAYDCECFYYERDGQSPYQPNFMCLTSSGYINHGQCYCGPPDSRNYVPDITHWQIDSGSFGTFFTFNQNLYSDAQSWSGKSFCFVIELSMPRAHGTIDQIWSNLYPYYSINDPTPEYYYGIESWETDVHIYDPNLIPIGEEFHVFTTVTMNSGYSVKNSMAQEFELYDDRFPWFPIASNCGMQIDHFKAYHGSYWSSVEGASRYNCREPKDIIENITSSYGIYSVTKSSGFDVIYISTNCDFNTDEALNNYMSSRNKATNALTSTLYSKDIIPVRVTFNTPLTINEYIDLIKQLNIDVSNYHAIGTNDTYGSVSVSAKDMPYNFEAANKLNSTNGIEVLGITSFTGYIEADNIQSLQQNSKVLLVDPCEDLTVKDLQQKYLAQGYQVVINPPEDLWAMSMMLKLNQ